MVHQPVPSENLKEAIRDKKKQKTPSPWLDNYINFTIASLVFNNEMLFLLWRKIKKKENNFEKGFTNEEIGEKSRKSSKHSIYDE